MIQLPSTYYTNNSRVVVGTPIIYADDVILLCDTSTGAVTINLLEIPDDQWNTTYKLYIVDNSANASVNNITINAGVGQLINDQPFVTISTDGECALIRIASNTQYLSTSSGGTIANPLEVLDEGISLTPNASSMNFVGDYVQATAVGTDVTITINAPDTGWVDLEGFTYQYALQPVFGKPQCRKIGKQIFFRGTVVIPLSKSGAAIIPIVNQFSYLYQNSIIPFQGDDGVNKGVVVDASGVITFNLDNSVIPTSVLPALTLLDGEYMNQVVATRPIATLGDSQTCLSSFFQLVIDQDKKLKIQTILYLENNMGTAGTTLNGSTPVRFITSYTRYDDLIPNYIGALSYIHNAIAPPPSPLVADNFLLGEKWPFTCDAADPNQIGAFQFKLDGLTAYIS